MLKNKKIRIFLISVFVIFLSISSLFYLYKNNQKPTNPINRQPTSIESELESLLKKVNRIIVLPEGEVPTVATVTDKNKVNNQQFFARSENGDKALIYTKAKKAFLYRPSANKIIEVMPINIESSASAKILVQPTSFLTSEPATTSPTLLPTLTND